MRPPLQAARGKQRPASKGFSWFQLKGGFCLGFRAAVQQFGLECLQSCFAHPPVPNDYTREIRHIAICGSGLRFQRTPTDAKPPHSNATTPFTFTIPAITTTGTKQLPALRNSKPNCVGMERHRHPCPSCGARRPRASWHG